MASRSSQFHSSLHRPRLIMGVEKSSFGVIVLAASFAFVAQAYWAMPLMIVIWYIAKWLTKKDDQYVGILLKYLYEDHVYDATPRSTDYEKRPVGWGRNLPR